MTRRLLLAVLGVLTLVILSDQFGCQQDKNCFLPDCLCSSTSFHMNRKDIPQIVYFGFDDALNVEMARFYRQLFSANRKNPNNCPISMSLYVSHAYTDYKLVSEFYRKGMEIGVHSVTHTNINTGEKIEREAKEQRENLAYKGNVPISEIVGWRSPMLITAGDAQPDILKRLGYLYDISLPYTRAVHSQGIPWPYTLDFGYHYPCNVPPCPSSKHNINGFWEVPINSMIDYESKYPCAYVDGCLNPPKTEDDAYKYLWQNFRDSYEGSRAPFGFNMHAGWFMNKDHLQATDRFIKEVLNYKDVYIVSVKQMLEWIRHPTPLSQINTFQPWQCVQGLNTAFVSPSIISKTLSASTTIPTTTTVTTSTTAPTTSTTTTIRTKPSTASSTTKTTLSTTTTTPSTTTPSRTSTTAPTVKTTPIPTTSTTQTPSTTTATHTKAKILTSPASKTFPTAVEFITSNHRLSTRTTFSWTSKANLKSTLYKSTMTHESKPTATSKEHTTKNGLPEETSSTPLDVNPRSTMSLSPLSQHSCIQGWNCRLPNCLCRNTLPPAGLPVKDVPQFVYFTFDGSVTFRTYSNLMKLFNRARRNPNNCPLSATLFVANAGNAMSVLPSLAKAGFEFGIKGDDRIAYHRAEKMGMDLSREINYFKANIPGNNLKGWRSPALKPLGDSQYQILKSNNLLYDSTLSMPVSESSSNLPWPYTLDFSWREMCEIPSCPKGKFPGLWEVPVASVYDYKGLYPCTYADGCMLNPPTAEDTFHFLWSNFQTHYLGNKSPVGINLRQQWFSHPMYKPNLQGLDDFIRKLTSIQDVYVVSVENVIEWMKSPVSLNRMQDIKLWDCN